MALLPALARRAHHTASGAVFVVTLSGDFECEEKNHSFEGAVLGVSRARECNSGKEAEFFAELHRLRPSPSP